MLGLVFAKVSKSQGQRCTMTPSKARMFSKCSCAQCITHRLTTHIFALSLHVPNHLEAPSRWRTCPLDHNVRDVLGASPLGSVKHAGRHSGHVGHHGRPRLPGHPSPARNHVVNIASKRPRQLTSFHNEHRQTFQFASSAAGCAIHVKSSDEKRRGSWA